MVVKNLVHVLETKKDDEEERREDIQNYHQYATTFVESEIAGVNENDLMESSLHKYMIVKNAAAAGKMEQQVSVGSNSFLGHHWISS
ncbi:hypothetical protein ACLOJK_035874 [Asimina triloba]